MDSTLDTYLREIKGVPLLSAEQEYGLAFLIREGRKSADWVRSLRDGGDIARLHRRFARLRRVFGVLGTLESRIVDLPTIDSAERQFRSAATGFALANEKVSVAALEPGAMPEGFEITGRDLEAAATALEAIARDHMIRANLRLVVSIAKGYMNKGLALMDLVEEGNLGLLRAVENFKPAKNCRFSTYGTHWIKQTIRRALSNTAKPVRIPSYMLELVGKWKQASERLLSRLGRPPNIHEIAEALGIPPENAELIRRAMRATQAAAPALSLDATNMFTLLESLVDDRTERPEAAIFAKQEIEKIDRLLKSLGDREAEILRMRYGLGDYDPMTLKDIGERIGLTRERVRQIENEALRKLNYTMTRTRTGITIDE